MKWQRSDIIGKKQMEQGPSKYLWFLPHRGPEVLGDHRGMETSTRGEEVEFPASRLGSRVNLSHRERKKKKKDMWCCKINYLYKLIAIKIKSLCSKCGIRLTIKVCLGCTLPKQFRIRCKWLYSPRKGEKKSVARRKHENCFRVQVI